MYHVRLIKLGGVVMVYYACCPVKLVFVLLKAVSWSWRGGGVTVDWSEVGLETVEGAARQGTVACCAHDTYKKDMVFLEFMYYLLCVYLLSVFVPTRITSLYTCHGRGE